VNIPPPKLMPRIGLAVLLVVVGSTPLAVGSPSISWSGQQNVVLGLGPDDNTTFFDLNSDGVDDFGFRNYNGTMSLVPLGNNAAAADSEWQSGHLNYLPMSTGALIAELLSSPFVWDTAEDELVSYMMHDPSGEVIGIGPWRGVTDGLLGISFEIDGQTHYGWVRMTDDSETAFVVRDWAFETQPGFGINAGVVPEPGTVGLFVCGLGALACSQWWRKKSRTKP